MLPMIVSTLTTHCMGPHQVMAVTECPCDLYNHRQYEVPIRSWLSILVTSIITDNIRSPSGQGSN